MTLPITIAPPPLTPSPLACAPTLRIALVTETYPPEVNGVAGTVAQVVSGLTARGHTVQLVRPQQTLADRLPLLHSSRGFEQVLLPGLPIPGYPQLKMGLPAGATLRRLWSAQRPDVVHIATEGPLGWSALRAARQLGLPVCSDFRTNFQAYASHYGLAWLRRPIGAYLRHFHNRCAYTMVPTSLLRDELGAQGFERLEVVSRGVDTERFHPAHRSAELRRNWGANDNTQVVLCVGRLAAEKNLGTVVATFSAMQQVRAASTLVFVGDGPARAELQAVCPLALFAGTRDGADLAAHYASADVFLFPSMTETFGNVTIEAMASGLPVVAYHHAAAATLIQPGVNGLLAALGQAGEFVRLALQLTRHPVAAQAMGGNARTSAQSMGWPQVIAQIEAVLCRAIAQSQPQSQPNGATSPAMSPAMSQPAAHATVQRRETIAV